ncbi:MAG: response regulator [Clostridiales bacterium]|nr:response regulator [Clostridiales bacterium]
MNIIAVDDEKLSLEALVAAVKENLPNETINSFRRTTDAEVFVSRHGCDIAFLDIEMRDVDGITLAKRIQEINPKVNIVFVTGYGDFTGEAFSLYASAYIMKPVTTEKIKKALETLRYGSVLEEGRLKAVTFGNFEVYYNGEPIKFGYKKTKELLAYLIDRRGAMCTNNEIIAVIWEDDDFGTDRQDYLMKLKQDLTKTMNELGAEDAVVKQRGQIGINPKRFECDYFKYLEGDSTILNSYQGEYMSQYSWAEYSIFKRNK